MQTIDTYIDQARAARGIHSDRELGRALGLGGQSVNNWRTKRAWPADDTMIALAKMAGVDKFQALMDLNEWRAKSPAVAHAYAAMRAKLAAVAASLLIVVGMASPAPAAPVDALSNMHYATN